MTDEKKAALDNLKKVVKEELYKCIRCGECRTVCPGVQGNSRRALYRAGQDADCRSPGRGPAGVHRTCARGSGQLPAVYGCAAQCGSEARADRVIMAARQAFAEELGLPAIKKAISFALTQGNAALGAEARVGALFQPLLFRAYRETAGCTGASPCLPWMKGSIFPGLPPCLSASG